MGHATGTGNPVGAGCALKECGNQRVDFAEFYRRSKDECLRTVLISVGDQDTAQELVAESLPAPAHHGARSADTQRQLIAGLKAGHSQLSHAPLAAAGLQWQGNRVTMRRGLVEMRLGMDDQRREEAPSETAQAWDSARRLREPIAWTLLVLTAIGLLISAWLLFGLPGTPPITAPGPVPVTPGPVPVTTFGLRAAAVAPQFVADGIFVLPIVSVILVAFAGGLTDRARPVVQTAISIQAVTLGLGVLSWLGAVGAHVRPGIWFISEARALAIVATGLIFTVAVRRSQALRPPMPQFEDFLEDDEDFGEEEED